MRNRTRHRADLVVSRGSLDHARRRRTFTLVRSQDLREGAALVIVLHGTFQTGDSIRDFSNEVFDEHARSGAAVVVYPDAIAREWNGARRATMITRGVKDVDDVGFLRALIDELTFALAIDAARVFVIGFSLGGQMAIRLLHEQPQLLAGAALIASNQPAPENFTAAATPSAAVPVVLIHGTEDPLAPYSGGNVGFRGMFPKGRHLSAAQTAGYFARRNGIHTAPTFHWLGRNDGISADCQICRTDYRRSGHAPVTLYMVVGGGHQIPGASTGPRWAFGRPTPGFSAVAVVTEFLGIAPH